VPRRGFPINAVDLQAEYDNRGKVAGSAAILDGWVRDAAHYRAGAMYAEYDLRYGPSERQVMDIFWPDADRCATIAMFIHGGYWQSLDKNWVSHFARGVVSRGIAVAIPSHDLCPMVSLAEIVRQIERAAAFLVRRHGRGIHSFGHSAGGHLTAMLLAANWAARGLPADAVTGGTSISGLFDLVPLVGTSVNAKLGLDEAEARRLSPLAMPTPRRPIRLLVGGLEGGEYQRQSTEMARHWCGHYRCVPGEHHFSIVAALTDADSEMVSGLVNAVRAGR
jgi:arylformamidase